MLSAEIEPIRHVADPRHNIATYVTRRIVGPSQTHLVIQRLGRSIRLDLDGVCADAAPLVARFVVPGDDRFDIHMDALAALYARKPACRRHPQLAQRLVALQAAEASAAGVSLMKVAEHILGPGDWPGDGEHRKSKVRRLINTGKRLLDTKFASLLSG